MNQRQENTNNPFIRSPDDVKLHIFGFFSKQDAAHARVTCTDLYKISQYPSVSPDKLPFADLDYFQFTKRRTIKPKSMLCVRDLITLSGRRIAISTGKRGVIKILDLIGSTRVKLVATLKGNSNDILAALSDSQFVSDSNSNEIKLWDLTRPAGKECVRTLTGHNGPILCLVALSKTRVVSGAIDNRIKIWDLTQPAGQECVQTIDAAIPLHFVAISADRLVCLSHQTLKIFDLTQPVRQECVKALGTRQLIGIFTILTNGYLATGGCTDDSIMIWDLTKPAGWELVKTFKTNQKGSITRLVCHPDGLLFSVSLDDATIKILDLTLPTDRHCVGTLKMVKKMAAEIVRFTTFLEDGRLVNVSGRGGSISFFNFKCIQPAPEEQPGCSIMKRQS